MSTQKIQNGVSKVEPNNEPVQQQDTDLLKQQLSVRQTYLVNLLWQAFARNSNPQQQIMPTSNQEIDELANAQQKYIGKLDQIYMMEKKQRILSGVEVRSIEIAGGKLTQLKGDNNKERREMPLPSRMSFEAQIQFIRPHSPQATSRLILSYPERNPIIIYCRDLSEVTRLRDRILAYKVQAQKNIDAKALVTGKLSPLLLRCLKNFFLESFRERLSAFVAQHPPKIESQARISVSHKSEEPKLYDEEEENEQQYQNSYDQVQKKPVEESPISVQKRSYNMNAKEDSRDNQDHPDYGNAPEADVVSDGSDNEETQKYNVVLRLKQLQCLQEKVILKAFCTRWIEEARVAQHMQQLGSQSVRMRITAMQFPRRVQLLRPTVHMSLLARRSEFDLGKYLHRRANGQDFRIDSLSSNNVYFEGAQHGIILRKKQVRVAGAFAQTQNDQEEQQENGTKWAPQAFQHDEGNGDDVYEWRLPNGSITAEFTLRDVGSEDVLQISVDDALATDAMLSSEKERPLTFARELLISQLFKNESFSDRCWWLRLDDTSTVNYQHQSPLYVRVELLYGLPVPQNSTYDDVLSNAVQNQRPLPDPIYADVIALNALPQLIALHPALDNPLRLFAGYVLKNNAHSAEDPTLYRDFRRILLQHINEDLCLEVQDSGISSNHTNDWSRDTLFASAYTRRELWLSAKKATQRKVEEQYCAADEQCTTLKENSQSAAQELAILAHDIQDFSQQYGALSHSKQLYEQFQHVCEAYLFSGSGSGKQKSPVSRQSDRPPHLVHASLHIIQKILLIGRVEFPRSKGAIVSEAVALRSSLEDEAFAFFATQNLARPFYHADLSQQAVHTECLRVETYVLELFPELQAQFENQLGADAVLSVYAEHLLTLFSKLFPCEYLFRIWDLLLLPTIEEKTQIDLRIAILLALIEKIHRQQPATLSNVQQLHQLLVLHAHFAIDSSFAEQVHLCLNEVQSKQLRSAYRDVPAQWLTGTVCTQCTLGQQDGQAELPDRDASISLLQDADKAPKRNLFADLVKQKKQEQARPMINQPEKSVQLQQKSIVEDDIDEDFAENAEQFNQHRRQNQQSSERPSYTPSQKQRIDITRQELQNTYDSAIIKHNNNFKRNADQYSDSPPEEAY